MARTHNKHIRVYVDGTDISGYARSVGPLAWTFDSEPDAAITDEVKNILVGKCNVSVGPYSAFLDTVATRPPILGSNVIVNGTFTGDTNWTKGTNWTITTTAVATAVTTGTLTATVAPLTAGKQYLVTYTIAVTAGDIAIKDGTNTGTTRTAAGTYEELFTSVDGSFLFFSPSSSFTGTIDNVSAKEYSSGLNADHGTRNNMIAIGANAVPAAGDNIFAWVFEQTAQTVDQGTGFVALSLPFGGASSLAPLTYKKPWGKLLYAKAARTSVIGVNTDAGIDDYGASTALGGIFVYQLFTSDGTVTLSAQDAAVNNDGGYADSGITTATSGAILATSCGKAGMVSLGTTATVRRYLRWQIAFGTATTATFAVGFIRNTLAS